MPEVVSNVAQSQREASSSPTVRSVPGPRNLTASKRCALRASARSFSRAACSCHATTGSSASSLIAVATACQRRSRSGSPSTVSAQPSFGAGTITQLTRRSVTSGRYSSRRSRGSALPTSAGSSPSNSAGSGFPVSWMIAGRVSCQVLTQSRKYGGVLPSSSSGPSSIAALRMCRSAGSGWMRHAPARNAARATARAIGTCSTWWKSTTSCPACTFAPTRTTSSANRSRRSSAFTRATLQALSRLRVDDRRSGVSRPTRPSRSRASDPRGCRRGPGPPPPRRPRPATGARAPAPVPPHPRGSPRGAPAPPI